jgi:tetratricopeptide (TPR) repeat protein
VRRPLAAVLLTLLAVPALAARTPEKVIDVRGSQLSGTSFEALWTAYLKAERAGDTENARRTFAEIRRLRIERNVLNLDSLGLALVAQGQERLKKGELDRAEESFRSAVALAPNLPDGHLGLAAVEMKKGPFGIVTTIGHTVAGVLARLPTLRGELLALTLLAPVGLLAAFAVTIVFGLAMVVRHGGLLRHDLMESVGPARSPSVSLAFWVVLLLLPVVSFQGYGWLPLWWLALLFVYMTGLEKAVAVLLLVLTVAVGPAVALLESRLLAARNPLFWAAAAALDGSSDSRAVADLDAAIKKTPDDRDLVYLMAAHHKKAGRYDEAMQLYRTLLQADPNDGIAKNNLANLEYARGELPSAIARYQQGNSGEGPSALIATFHYNESLAHLQKFEYQPAQESRSHADRLDPGVVAEYDRTWKFDNGNYAVVDLNLSHDQVWVKFAGTPAGVGARNVVRTPPPALQATLLPSLVNRFSGAVAAFVLVVMLVSIWRGRRSFTMHCAKCGTAFCRRCHLGAVIGDLCTQCHHLFMVRDGVSGPARNKKLMEVQKVDARRSRIFRLLSVFSPGAGQLYAQKTLAGTVLLVVWYLLGALVILSGRVFAVTEAPADLTRPWGAGVAAVLLVLTWVLANRGRPEFESAVPVRRMGGAARRGRAA